MADTVTDEMVELAQRAYETFGQQGHMKTRRPSDACMRAVLEAALPLLRERIAERVDGMYADPAYHAYFIQARMNIASAIRADKGGET